MREGCGGLGVLASATVMAISATAQTGLPADTALTGRYELRGIREVGAELALSADHRFEFGMTYGAVDLSASGRWALRGRVVTLTTDPVPAAGFELNRSSADLPDAYSQSPDKPTLLVVEVKTPRLGLTWSNMAVVGEFSNGQSRSGVTGNNGMVGFLDRTEPEWRGTYVRRISVAYPQAKIAAATFDIDARSTRLVQIDFEPGDMAPPAFESATLGVDGAGPAMSLVQQSPEGPGKVGWKFVRQ